MFGRRRPLHATALAPAFPARAFSASPGDLLKKSFAFLTTSSPSPPPDHALLDSPISEGPSGLDGVELNEAVEHDDGTRLTGVTGPAAEARKYPGGGGERALGMGVFLCRCVRPSRLFETASRAACSSLSMASSSGRLAASACSRTKLQHSDGGNKAGRDKLLESTFDETQSLAIEALCLERAKQLLNDPALAIQGDNPARIGNIGYFMAGQQAPGGDRRALRLVDFQGFHNAKRNLGRWKGL